MVKRGLLLILVVVMGISMFGCAGSGSTPAATPKAEKVKITFWDENAGPTQTEVYKELIKRFEEKNADIKVEYVGLPQESAKQKYDTAIATKTVPDVGGVPQTWLSSFIANNALLDLEPYFSKWEDKSKLSATYVEANRGIAPDRKLYNLPYTDTTDVIWYRTDWFKNANIAVPDTFAKLFDAMAKLTDKSKNVYGFTLRGGPGGTSQLETYLFAYSGIADYFDQNGKSNINLPIHVEALDRYKDIYKKYTAESDVANGYKEMVAAFDSGAAAMMHHNQGSYSDHKNTLGDDKFKATLFPKGANGKRTFTGGSANGLSIFKDSKNPDAAWKFISFLVSAESNSYWNEKIGQMPINTDVVNYDWVKNSQYIQVALEALKDPNTVIRMRPVELPGYSSVHKQILEPAFQNLLLGKTTSKDFLDQWAAAMEKEKKEFEAGKK